MCLVVLAHRVHAEYPLIVAGNRDEFHARPTLDAGWWTEEPAIAGGRDLSAGGSWLAVSRRGRFATVTNVAGRRGTVGEVRSRGHLVADFLRGEVPPLDYLRGIAGEGYEGFNLLVADGSELAYGSNRGDAPRLLPPGIYGIGNERLDSTADKVSRSKAKLESLLGADEVGVDALLGLLDDREGDPPTAAPFVEHPEFGTRCSTVVTVRRDGDWRLVERRFDAAGHRAGESALGFVVAEDG
jgi:uncharacterized protein with NRDE domain